MQEPSGFYRQPDHQELYQRADKQSRMLAGLRKPLDGCYEPRLFLALFLPSTLNAQPSTLSGAEAGAVQGLPPVGEDDFGFFGKG
jgi:hypothetical protein